MQFENILSVTTLKCSKTKLKEKTYVELLIHNFGGFNQNEHR